MRHESIQELFGRTAERCAGRVAAEHGAGSVTYAELEARSNRLANFLLARGAPKGSRIVILSDDSIAVASSIIAVLRAGCVFVPLDPASPDARLAALAADVTPAWFLTDSKHAHRLGRVAPDGTRAGVVELDAARTPNDYPPHLTRFDDYAACNLTERPAVESEPDDMCYIYFTSGSTGRPKGIAGRLKSIDHFVRWELKTLGLGEGVRVSQLITPSFDAFLRDIFVPLCAGGTVCVPPAKETVLDAAELARWLDAARVNLIHCVPSLFRTLLNEGLRPGQFAALRHVLLSGEPLLPSDVRRWVDVFGERVRLVNLYGPSETTMTKFFYFVEPSDKDAPFIPIGKPMEGAKALVVGEGGKACRAGKVGEIYIRTPYRTLGYFNHPELTREVFVPNPFSDNPDDIVYKTGDLGRVLEDGNFEFLGRKDQQVKIRGVRVEPKEIENLLRSHESVRDVAVIDREDSPGEKYLCSYLVLGDGTSPGDLRDFLASRLPATLVPAAFVELESLPRTLSGKLDRRALPPPGDETRARKTQYVAPRTATEEAVAAIWAAVLGVERVGVEDNYFELGGHSLLITRILARVGKAFGVELPLRTIFEAPTVAALAARVESSQGAARDGAWLPLLPVAREERDSALSFAQQRLWFFDQLDPGGTFYNIPFAVRFGFRVDTEVLRRSLDEIVRRHETLRTSFQVVDGLPVQVVATSLSMDVPVVDLTHLPPGERGAEARRLGREEAERPFDLSRAPLVRARLLRLGPVDDVLLVTMHHIVSDNWSINILMQELAALYEAFAEGRPSPLAELPVQYADFAHWQRRWLSGGVEQRQLAYWKARLAGAPPALELPTDRPRPATQTFNGARETFALPKELSDELARLARAEGVSTFMLLLAAFQSLLGRYANQTDICVGAPTAGRDRLEVEGLIGFFVNTLVLRTDLSGDPTFKELLARVREGCLGAYAHQDVPFERLVEELHPERSLSHVPLFQVMFVFQNAQTRAGEDDGRVRKISLLEDRKTTFDLTLGMAETPEGFVGLLDYSTDLFDAATMRRLLEHFRMLLAGAAADPALRLSELPLLTDEERRFLLRECNGTAAEVPRATLVTLFEEQARRTPDAEAVVYGDERLSYAELDARAELLASHQRARGVGPESVVGVLTERSTEMLVALLGVLKAGAAYLPLEPTYPAPRIAYMLEDARPALVLTQRRLRKRLPDGDGAPPVFALDEEWAESEEVVRAEAAGPDNAAYVIYTSGSTGRPKGVVVTHRAVCNTLFWRRRTFSLAVGDRVLQNIPFTFDPSVWQMFGALISGATLVLVEPEGHQDSAHLVDQMARQQITVTDFAPSQLQVLLEQEGLERCQHLRCVFTGGEAVPVGLPPRFYARLNADLFNQYGPTEAAIDATYWKCEREGQRHSLPIGRPIDNKQVYVLDAHLRPVPPGICGELHIGGPGLARGYLRNPALTAERFIPDPFDERGGGRLYRTGDLARFLPGGELEFLGRADKQVKIRGHRVELGEVEAALNTHTALRECVVVARADAAGEKRLVAYAVPASTMHAPAAKELRIYLKARLPEYMVPSRFVLLDALPRTTSGKVNHEALPDPDAVRPARAHEPAAAGTPVEEVLCGILGELLGLEEFGVHDDFFESGGHSLLATRAVSRVREVFSVELPLRRIFESPTAAELAVAVESLLKRQHDVEVTRVEPTPRDGELPLSFAQQRLWFLEQLHPGNSAYNVSLAARLSGPLRTDALEQALGEIVRRHEVLRTSFEAAERQPVAVIHPPLPVPVSYEDLSSLAAEEREAVARARAASEARHPLDLTRHPLLRACVLRLGEEEHVLLLTMHHIVSDGWSIGVLRRELAALYTAFSAGRPSPLAEPSVHYADYAVWQRQRFSGEPLRRELDYWRRQLSGTLPTLGLPTDRSRPSVQTFAGAHEFVELPDALRRELHALSRREGVTLFMTLLAAFQALLHRYTGQEDILVGTPIANRNQVALEGLVGLFVNTLALRTDLSGDPTFAELLGRVRGVALGAYAHQELPFEELVREIQPERDVSRSPIFQVLFTLQNATPEPAETTGLRLSELSFESGTVQFDLTLSVREGRDGLACALGYSTDLFDATTIRRLLEHFRMLLAGAAADPALRLSELPLLAEAERQFLLHECNDTSTETPEATFPELFREQARRTPHAEAVVHEGLRLTYAELDARSDVLASRLLGLGAGPESLVGVLMERSAEMLVALLGVLKAGAAYVPLDASYPAERLLYMVKDSGLEVLVAGGVAAEVCAAAGGVRVLEVEATREETRGELKQSGSAAGPDNAAYVIYTSGSTGRPKGVVVTHRALVNLLDSMRHRPGCAGTDRLLAVTTLSFDIAALELFLPLTVGGCVIVAGRPAAADGALLSEHLRQVGATVMQATPVTWRMLLEAGWQGDTSLKVLCGGEALPWELARELVARAGSVWNMYGPTETTIWSGVCELRPEDGRVSIGRPIQNTQFYALGTRGEVVPVGAVGELHIGGEGLARGYLKRPGLTAERFVPDPFSTEPGARLYRTGDLARYRPDGELEYLGRVDQQVKLRGHRIELGEVESVLSRHPRVRQAVALVREDEPGKPRLVAYLIAQGEAPTVGELRGFAAAQLPEYMLPSAFVTVGKFPLTLNGKIDRGALPAPGYERQGAHGAYVAPSDPLELQLVRVWEEILDITPVGVTDNFFELGGHSFLTLRLTGQIKRRFGRDVPLASFFRSPTVRQLASILRGQGVDDSHSPLVVVQPAGSRPPFFCMHEVTGSVLRYTKLAQHLGADQPFYALQTPKFGNGREPYRDIEEMAADYVKAVREVQPEGPYRLGGWSYGGVVAFEMARQLEAAGHEVGLLAMIDAAVPPPADGQEGPPDEVALLVGMARMNHVELSPERLRRLDPRERLHHVLEEARLSSGAASLDLDVSQLQTMLDAARVNLRARAHYAPRLYPKRITVFRSAESLPDDGGAQYRAYRDPALGWGELSTEPVEVHTVPGNHFTLFAEPNIRVLAERLNSCLQESRERAADGESLPAS